MQQKSHSTLQRRKVTARSTLPLFFLLLFASLIAAYGHAEDAQGKSILVFGDSLSAAYGIDEEAGWVNLLAEQMIIRELPHRVSNASVSGETTSGGLARLPAILDQQKPDIVILELGGNDGLRGLPIRNIRQNLLAMIDLIEASGAQTILAGIQIPPNYGPRYTGPFASIFPEIAQERDLLLVPFLIEGIPEHAELMQNDGIHPVAEAQPIVVENVWPVLERAL
ncbi:MAG: arylesterase [Pseudomonadales bacterium]|nr:arylesterase [Pseudomonadales bacterium]